MALFVTDTGKRSELQERLAAELREKMARAGEGGGEPSIVDESPDLVEDSSYIKDFEKKSSVNGRVVALVGILVAVALVCGLVIVLQ
ncbi:hypothetical protein FACS189431_1520 [Alphaproteobacteria bacterium]|nr:hypothetical protein FACS189431_1520 [Alphaproteobacteria bacterium]